MGRRETIQNDYLPELRREIDAALERWTRFSDDSPRRLTDAVRYSLLAPGKRLRPTLTLLAAELCGGTRVAAIPAAVAVEAIHAYSLIHDDLPAMDDDDLRRGRPTCHKKFDEATAILAGDALLTFAFETLADKLADSTVAARAVWELARAAGPCGMVGGQADDVLWSATTVPTPGAFDLIASVLTTASEKASERSDSTLKETPLSVPSAESEDGAEPTRDESSRLFLPFLRKIHRRKTGAMIRVALRLGALIAGASDFQLKRLDFFGRYLGRAFQIADDLLDATGDEATMGKRVQKDADSGKLTYVTLLGVDESRRLLGECVVKAKLALRSDFIEEFDSTADESDSSATSNSSRFPAFDVALLPYDALIYLADYVAERRQ